MISKKSYPTLIDIVLIYRFNFHNIKVSDSVKLQKTEPGGGYHVWHSERTAGFLSGQLRELAYTIYLNDVDEGGETEFLMQHRRVQPKKGLLLIWPAYFTHKHRGNPPLKGEKYIATGWILNGRTNQPA